MKDRPLLKNGEFYLGIVIIAFTCVMFAATGKIKHDTSRVWPYVVLVPLALSGAAIFISSFRKSCTPVASLKMPVKVLLSIAAILAMILIAPFTGLLPALFLMTIALNIIIQGAKSPKQAAGHVLFAAVLYAACWLVFDLWLKMYLPAGSLFGR